MANFDDHSDAEDANSDMSEIEHDESGYQSTPQGAAKLPESLHAGQTVFWVDRWGRSKQRGHVLGPASLPHLQATHVE
eukprot:8393745-Karenia_brevis.AAC.1